ncbi:MAG: hypothetical protein AAFX05_07540 [Planctomycetota bacterium]
MAGKMCPKVILEGTRLTHKTDLAFALNEHPGFVGPRKYRYHSPLISGEWCAFTNVPWGRGLINFEPDEEALALETYEAWLRIFELQRYASWIIDRWHLSTIAYQQRAHGNTYDFSWLEERMAPLGFRLVLCVRDERTFEAARAERLKISGNPSQYDDLTPFIEEQAVLRSLARASNLPVLEVDVSHDDVERAADEVVAWLEATDGIVMAE